jgi:hypothetical protein
MNGILKFSYYPTPWSRSLMICPNIELQDRSEGSSSDDDAADNTVMGFASAVIWLVGMAAVIAMLSNYVITTIEVLNLDSSGTLTMF